MTADQKYGDRLRSARLKLGLSQQAVAERLGTSQQTITRLERGETVASRYLTAYELFLGLSGEGGEQRSLSTPQLLPHIPPNASPAVPVRFQNATIGMYGSAMGGEDGRFVLNGNRLLDVLCPPSLIGVQDAYGVFVHGNSMKPRYLEGEGVFVNPHLPVRQNDYVVVQVAGEFDGDDLAGYVKQFISRNSREIVLAQHQRPESWPEEPFTDDRWLVRFPREKVVAAHRIVWAGEV